MTSRTNLQHTRAVTNATGTTCFSADYYPYGQENEYNTSCTPEYKFTEYMRKVGHPPDQVVHYGEAAW